MFSLKRVFSFAVVLAMLFVSCNAEDGDTGPIGPVGLEGPIGPAGAGDPGVDGTDGRDGVANIQSYTYTIASTDWNSVNVGGLNYIEDTISAPEITQGALDNGALLAYMKVDVNDPSWQVLPYQDYVVYSNGTQNVFSIQNYQASFTVGALNVRSFINSNVSFTTNAGIEVKLVIIPPAVKVDGFDPKTYEEAKMVYGFED